MTLFYKLLVKFKSPDVSMSPERNIKIHHVCYLKGRYSNNKPNVLCAAGCAILDQSKHIILLSIDMVVIPITSSYLDSAVRKFTCRAKPSEL